MLNGRMIKSRILMEMGRNRKGMSSWDLEKSFGRDNITFQRIQPYLEGFRRMGVLKKTGSKYSIDTPFIIRDGTIITADPPMIINCPYFGGGCDCKGKITMKCRYIGELPKPISDFFASLMNKK